MPEDSDECPEEDEDPDEDLTRIQQTVEIIHSTAQVVWIITRLFRM